MILAGCALEPVDIPPVASTPPPDTAVYFYPSGNGTPSSPQQQDRDKYECNTWAVAQTGFDPSQPNIPPHHRIQAIAGGPPPGAGVAAGAVTGAVVGAAVANPWESGRGALLGALAGTAIGGIAEAEHADARRRALATANADADTAALERQASRFRRALSACLEGRGYAVR